MVRLILILWISGAIFVGWLMGVPPFEYHNDKQWIPTCQEDDPCWDCTTMGNKICGK